MCVGLIAACVPLEQSYGETGVEFKGSIIIVLDFIKFQHTVFRAIARGWDNKCKTAFVISLGGSWEGRVFLLPILIQ